MWEGTAHAKAWRWEMPQRLIVPTWEVSWEGEGGLMRTLGALWPALDSDEGGYRV